jgi:hypothetical protein
MSAGEVMFCAVELSRAVTAKDKHGRREVVRTVGEAARFLRANLAFQRQHDQVARHAARCLGAAAADPTAERIANATMAVEIVLQEEGLLISR